MLRGRPFHTPRPGTRSTQVTGIANDNRIGGVYYNASSSVYHGFVALPVGSTYGAPTPEPPSANVYLAAINDIDNGNGLRSYGVGFAPPLTTSTGCIARSIICGVVYDPNANSVSQVSDTNQGSGSCAATYLFGTSDPKIQVGYYLIANGGGTNCTTQAVEEYVYPNEAPTFANFSPCSSSAFTGTGCANSKAYGINNKGDVVGTVTTNSGSVGWEYREFTYSKIADPNGSNTQALGINWADDIVGSYQDTSSVLNGFLLQANSNDTYYTEDFGTYGTVVNAINDAGEIVGWHEESGVHHYFDGFIGTCSPCPGVRGSSSGTRSKRVGSTAQSRGAIVKEAL
jgi:hypothetical protein